MKKMKLLISGLLICVMLSGCGQKPAVPVQNDDSLSPEEKGEVETSRTYKVESRMDTIVSELYCYKTPDNEASVTDKGENLAGSGMEKGDQVEITVTGYMLHTPNETLWTLEYVAGGETYYHKTIHVEDQLLEVPIYLIGADGISAATAVSFGNSNLAQ